MKKIVATILILLFWVSTSHAGLLNRYDDWKDFFNSFRIKHGMFFDCNASRWAHVICGNVFDFHAYDVPIASIDAGYIVQDIAVGMTTLNIPALEELGIDLHIGNLKPYISTGAGYDFRHHEPIYGVGIFGFTWEF